MNSKGSIQGGVPASAGNGQRRVAARPGVAAVASGGKTKPPLFADDAQFWFETLRVLGAAAYGGSEAGEVLVTAATITAGDYDSWYDAWSSIAGRIEEEAASQLAHGHRISARDGFLRASTYHRASELFLHGSPRDPRISSAYRRSVDCYRSCARLCDPPIDPVEIPYGHTTLPGYFHHAPPAPGPCPTLIMHTGFDGSAEELHVDGARAAVERGYNVLAFDGPGQFGPLHREGLPFRPDWEKVVTPVVDFCLLLPRVDPRKIALMGISLGGELAPRAAAHEKRLAALIANDGLYDYGAANLAHVPAEQRPAVERRLQGQEAPELDQMLAAGMNASPTARWGITHGMYAMGVSTPRAYMAATLDYNLRNGVAEAISCPTLVCSPEGDLFFKGQAQELFEHLTCRKTMLPFAASEGAGDHCQVGARRMAFARIYDWLDDTLAQRATGN